MAKLIIEGGNTLRGTVRVDNSKNAILPILASVILLDGKTILRDIPRISDVDNLLHILAGLGCKIRREGADLHIDSSAVATSEVSPAIAEKIRGSIMVLGSLLGRFKTARVPYPGGCAIGNRPIDLHIQGLRDLGIRVEERGGFIICNSKRAKGGSVYLDYPSVGATENLILAAALGRNNTRIINAAKEPEVVDLCNFLNACGARICGAGTSVIVIHGVKALHGATYTPIPDRIITGSYLLAVAAAGGDVMLSNTCPSHNESLLTKLTKSGCLITCDGDKIHIRAQNPHNTKAWRPSALTSIQTSPYPGFPTDLQSQITVLQAISKGTCVVTENLFESRFKYIPELIKMGAKITVKDRSAIITGTDKFTAGKRQPLQVTATDLRGGVALVIAALAADGTTIINNADFIYRGHAEIEKDLAALGANIIKIDD